MKKLLTLLAITAAGVLIVPASFAAEDAPPTPPGAATAPAKDAEKPEGRERRPGGRGLGDPGARLKLLTEKLSLTQDQQDKIKAIYEANAPKIKEVMAKGRDALTDEDRAKLREITKAQMEDVAAVLTPEQKEKMKALRAEGGRGEGRGPGRGEGRPGAPK